jgi:hypothetical protein
VQKNHHISCSAYTFNVVCCCVQCKKTVPYWKSTTTQQTTHNPTRNNLHKISPIIRYKYPLYPPPTACLFIRNIKITYVHSVLKYKKEVEFPSTTFNQKSDLKNSRNIRESKKHPIKVWILFPYKYYNK